MATASTLALAGCNQAETSATAQPELPAEQPASPAQPASNANEPGGDQAAKPGLDEQAAKPEPAAANPEAAPVEAKPIATAEKQAEAPKPGTAKADSNAAPEAEAPAVKGNAAASDTFNAWLQGSSNVEVGKPASVTAVLTAQGDYHCNDKYPYKFTLDPAPAGVTYPNQVVQGMNVGQARSAMSIPFVATEKGAKTISGTLAFSVCNEDRCLIEKQKLSVTVNVM